MIKRLSEIDVIRMFVIAILVLMHSFAPHGGAWAIPIGVECQNSVYFWLHKVLYSGMLETFVCISGFLYAFGCSKKTIGNKQFIIGKLKHIYLPSVVWSALYILLFRQDAGYDMFRSVRYALYGVGHLWFLPMLFLCFMLERFVVAKIKRHTLIILAIIAVLPYPGMPFSLNRSFYYLFFFHFGVLLFSEPEKIKSWKLKKFVCLYILLFVIGSYLIYFKLHPENASNIISKAMIIMVQHIVTFCYSLPMLFIYFIVGYSIKSKNIHNFAQTMAPFAFGVYIFQEFILRILYYFTPFCAYMGDLMFPWVGFAVALIVSFALSYCCNRIRWIKPLIG